jgi:hypothetical protein
MCFRALFKVTLISERETMSFGRKISRLLEQACQPTAAQKADMYCIALLMHRTPGGEYSMLMSPSFPHNNFHHLYRTITVLGFHLQ